MPINWPDNTGPLSRQQGANYRVTIDGVTRTNHDVCEVAIEIGKLLKDKNCDGGVKVCKIDDGSRVAEITLDNGHYWLRRPT